MLKWFRLYNKFILVIGGCLLMVAFLIQPVLSMFMPHPGNQPLGTIGGVEITLADQQDAGRELAMARQTHQLIAMITGEEPLQWLLMKQEAAKLGISASGYEVTELLTNLGVTEPMLADQAKNSGATVLAIKDALASWLTVQNYKELLIGTAHSSPVQKIRAMSDTQQMFNNLLSQGQNNPQMQQMYMQYFYQRLGQIQTGAARVSKPLVEHFINDQQSRVKIAYAQIPLTSYLDKVTLESQAKETQRTVTEAELLDTFNKYKDNLPGTSKPYGFGYRFPERVKFEYLALSQEDLMPLVKISEADAVAFYDANPNYFTETVPAPEPKEGEKPAEPTTRVKPYVDVRDQIIEHLKQTKAGELGDKIIKTAQTILIGDVRSFNVVDGYRVLPDGFKPMSLEQVALEIQKQFNVLPAAIKLDKDWLDKDGVAALQGIAYSSVMGKARVEFSDYLFSVKEIERETPSAQASLRLQAGVVSMPMSGYDGSRYLFRVIDAQAERSPASLDEVRMTVAEDAKKLAAFSLQLADINTWRERLTQQVLQEIAKDLGSKVEEPSAFQRRQVSMGGEGVPNVTGIGQDEQFVDGVFKFAMENVGDDAKAFAQLAAEKRSTVVAAPSKLALYLVRVDEVHPVTEQQFASRMTGPDALQGVGSAIQNAVLGSDITSPFEFDTLAKRVGFVSANPVETKKDTDKAAE